MVNDPTPRASNSKPGEEPVDPKPLAAYQLLHDGQTFRLWQHVFWDRPAWLTTEAGMTVTLAELEEAVDVLVDEINVNVYQELRSTLNKLRRLADDMMRAWESTGKYQAYPFGSSVLPGKTLWQRLRRLADRALMQNDWLERWAALGGAVGSAELRLYEERDREEPIDLQPILKSVQALPGDQLRDLPVLQSLVEQAGSLEHVHPVKLLQQVLGPGRMQPILGEIESDPTYEALVTLLAFDKAIQENLKDLRPESGIRVESEPGDVEDEGPGYLGMVLVPGRHLIRRAGSPQTVDLKGNVVYWEILRCLMRREHAYCSKTDLIQEVWVARDSEPEDATVWSAVSHLRKQLQPLGVTIRAVKGLGYRLEEVEG